MVLFYSVIQKLLLDLRHSNILKRSEYRKFQY